ncbi:MAG: STAS/SEC14 domain-containing protein [Pseudomonadota bacterium]
MIKLDTIADGQIHLAVEGKLEREDITTTISALEAARNEHNDVNVLIDMTGFAGMTAEALVADLRYGLGHLTELKHYKRIAIVTDADWIEALVWIEGRLLRQTDMRCFGSDEIDHAKVFVAGEDVPERHHDPSVIRIASDRADLIAFEIRDKVRTADAHAMFGFLNAAYEVYGKIDLMIIIRDFEGFELGMLFDGETWRAKSASLSHIDKYAVVGGPASLTSTAQFIGGFLPVDIKAFSLDEKDKAWAWVGARPLLL